jgi:hypothetical protein
MSKREKTGLFIIILFIALLGVGSLSFDYEKIGQPYGEIEKSVIKSEQPESTLEKKEIGPNYKIAYLEIEKESYKGEVIEGESVYDFMNRLKERNVINFKEKTYAGLGKFIEEINGIKGNGEKYWIYYVNGEKAKIGVSIYKLNPGDVVSWKYENDLTN